MLSCCKDEISVLCFEAAGACSGSLKELAVYPRKESNERELSLKTEKNCYGEEGFHFIFGVEKGRTRTNRWILQEDKILIY